MKKLSILLACLVLTLCFGTPQSFAQSKIDTEKFIIIEVIIPNEGLWKVVEKLKVPISKNLRKVNIAKNGLDIHTENKNNSFEVSSTNGGAVDCNSCPLTSEFRIGSIAKFIDEIKAQVDITLSFRNQEKCNQAKQFQVIQGKQSNIKLKCSVKIIANYEVK